MGRGQNLAKRESDSEVVVTQRFYADEVVLSIDKSKCIGCDLCTSICPKEAAVRVREKERLIVTVDADKCVLCGACEPFCPSGAIVMKVSNQPKNILVERQGLPVPLDKILIDAAKCPPDCLKCVDACPVQAIRIGQGHDIRIDTSKCLRCPWCADVCDKGAIVVNPLFVGSIRIDTSKCSEGCDLCAKVCKTKAIRMEGGKAKVEPRYCILCGACTNVCEDDAIDLRRTRVLCAEGFSTVWSSALEKLLGARGLSRVQDNRALRRLGSIIEESRVK